MTRLITGEMMNLSQNQKSTYESIEEKLNDLTRVTAEIQQYLKRTRSASIPVNVFKGVDDLIRNLPRLKNNLWELEGERKEYRTLSQIGQVVNSSLDIDVVLQIVMDTIIQLTEAERGFLMLREANQELGIRVARNWEQEEVEESDYAISKTVINRVVENGLPLLTTNASEDPRFSGQDSIVAHNLRSILCVPMKNKGEVVGVIYADNRIRSGLFAKKDLELLTAFANQAVVAIQNARLFASVRQTLAEVTELKNIMDNVFASIASGVITADIEGNITLCNLAAERILGTASNLIVGDLISEAFPPLAEVLNPELERVVRTERHLTGLETSPIFPEKGQIDLRLSISPLKDAGETTQGVAIVMEDLTERNKLEAKKRLFERMVSPAVIEQLDPDAMELGGQRREISAIFADIRGFTSFSEQVRPEELVAVLNRHLSIAGEEILKAGGTIDKFLGDAVMAWFNAPVPQPGHELLAAKAAVNIKKALQEYQKKLGGESEFQFGIGLHVGDAILGLVGTEQRMEYTAIGDSINTAKRIQEHAAANQILISESFYFRVHEKVIARPFEVFKPKGKREELKVFELFDVID